MRLTYRGNDYEPGSVPMQMRESGSIGLYRGQELYFSYPRHVPVPQPVNRLQYRGVSYCTSETGELTSTGFVARSVSPLQSRHAVSKLTPLVDHQELAKVHHQYLMERLQRRLEVARAKGDDRLVHQLEQEQHQLV
ncbi:MAG: hypothetical protein Fur0046_31980 [Cyanobacteria bacterium J069]|nr:MAG: DUF4278 domain-containing protein [Cyanobacteria bacterium J069]